MQSIGIGALLGGGISFMRGESSSVIAKNSIAAAGASGISRAAFYAASANGMLAPFWGPLAGIAAYLLTRKILDHYFPLQTTKMRIFTNFDISLKVDEMFPLINLPEKPIGTLKDGILTLRKTHDQEQ